jgi:hypothetical protein
MIYFFIGNFICILIGLFYAYKKYKKNKIFMAAELKRVREEAFVEATAKYFKASKEKQSQMTCSFLKLKKKLKNKEKK